MKISWNSRRGRIYGIYSTTNLVDGDWEELDDSVEGEGEITSFTDPGVSLDDKKRFYRKKVDFDTNLDRFTKYGQRLLTKGNYKKPTETVEESRSLLDKIKSGASSIKSKMDATKMLTSRIPGGAVALTPLDFIMSMSAGVPLGDAAASAGSYLLKDPYLGKAVNIPLALRAATDYGDADEMLQKATDRREKGEAFLEGLLDKVKGAGDQPDIDPFQAAEGGRVGFNGGGAVGADDNFAAELEYFLLNPDAELPKADSYRETMNPVALVNDMIDPRNYAYYGDRLAETGIRIGEFGARVLPALGQLTADLIRKPAFKVTGGTGQGYVQDYTDVMPSNIKGTGIFTEFLNNLVGTEGTKVITEKTGLADLIRSEEQKQKDKTRDIVKENISSVSLISNELEEIRDEFKADRVWIAQFHNGGNFYPTGKSIQKFSIFYEVTKAGVSSVSHTFNNIPCSLYPKAFEHMMEGKGIFINDYKEAIEYPIKHGEFLAAPYWWGSGTIPMSGGFYKFYPKECKYIYDNYMENIDYYTNYYIKNGYTTGPVNGEFLYVHEMIQKELKLKQPQKVNFRQIQKSSNQIQI